MSTIRVVTLGDSVCWGQGLNEEQKYDTLLGRALASQTTKVTIERVAHSGALIGDQDSVGLTATGEVPVASPTIIQQCERFENDPASVNIVLLNGGINDIGVARILNPFALLPSLSFRIRRACRVGMGALLSVVTRKFSAVNCRILVTGYYPILSELSDPFKAMRVLNLHGISRPPFAELGDVDFIEPVVARCTQFFEESTTALEQAIADVGDSRVKFVATGFTAANAMFTDNPLLWALDRHLNPQDPVAPMRRPQCDLTFDAGRPIERIVCHRASVGHPNVEGARQIAEQTLAVLGRTDVQIT
jgi:lysophospholipase L1-like esterase